MKWTVYRATSPSGKCYIGITSRKLEKRIAEGVWAQSGHYGGLTGEI